MKKMFEIAYINEEPKSEYFGLLRFADVCADNQKQAKEIFFRHHDNTCNIVHIRFKRKWR